MMAFYPFIICIMQAYLVVALLHDAVTQPSPAVHCQQLSPVPRPKGKAVLVCGIFGIRSDEMMFYWWLHVTPSNIQTPIYTYSDVYTVDEITTTYRDMVVNETHVISQRHMTSEIKLLINMTTNGVFKFEITMASHQSYSEEVEISFEDPQITLNMEEMPTSSAHGSNSVIILVATCYVDACFSKPTMSILCNDIEDDNEIVCGGQFDERDPVDYFSTICRAVIKTRNCSQIKCSVADERGTYHATRNVSLFEDSNMRTAPASLGGYEYTTVLIPYILLGVVVLISIMGAACVYVYIRRLRVYIDKRPCVHNPNEKESDYQPMITIRNGNLNPRGNITSIQKYHSHKRRRSYHIYSW